MILYETEHFRLEPCKTCPLPGYLILSAKGQQETINDLSELELFALGPTLARVSEAVQFIMSAERLYAGLFCEAQRGVHFHIFPRTPWLQQAYLKHYSSETLIDGPRLLSWARRTFVHPSSTLETERTNLFIAEYLKTMPNKAHALNLQSLSSFGE